MTSFITDSITRNGYAFVHEYSSGTDTYSIASSLGYPMVSWKGRLVQKLVPRATSTPNTYSGLFGYNRFPLHTDLAHWRLPPRYILLRCLRGYTDVPTLLLDGWALAERITLNILARAIFKPRRPKDGAIILLRLCETIDDGHRLRWDPVFLKPASKIGHIANEKIRNYLTLSQPLSISLASQGDTLLIDNWRMLHARSPIPAHKNDRIIERIYLEELK